MTETVKTPLRMTAREFVICLPVMSGAVQVALAPGRR